MAWIVGFIPGLIGQGLLEFSGAFYSSFLGGFASQSQMAYDQDGVTVLRGTRFSAQVYAGKLGAPEDELAPLERVRSYGNFDGLLLAEGTNNRVVIPGVPAGQSAQVQLRVWDNAGGTVTNWELAQVRGRSVSFESGALGDGKKTAPPFLKVPESFQLLPAIQRVSPATGQLREIYRNLDFPLFNPDNPPDHTFFMSMSTDGNLVTSFLQPKYSFSPDPKDPRRGATTWRRLPGDSELVFLEFTPPPLPAGLAADDRRVGYNNLFNTAVLTRNNSETPLPIRYVEQINSDGHFIFDFQTNDNYVRLDTFSLQETLLLPAPNSSGYGVGNCTHDGRAALLTGYQKPPLLWIEGQGIQVPKTPAGFVATGIAEDLRTLAGSMVNSNALIGFRPAYWTEATGVVLLSPEESSFSGQLDGVSTDGSVFYGSGRSPAGGNLQFWTRDGRGYALAKLLPNGAATGLKGWNNFKVLRLSDNGRTALITGQDEANVMPWGDIGWFADLVFPGGGPRLWIVPAATSLPTLKFPIVAGFRYRMETSEGVGSWTTLGAPWVGNGSTVSVVLPPLGDVTFARVIAEAAE